jgi:hypothetical protein
MRSKRTRTTPIRGVVAAASALLAMACTETAAAADLHVDARNGGTTDGSAARPFRSIQAAVDAAAPGDVVKIARGTYAEAVFVDVANLSIEGGYAGATADTYAAGGAGDFATRDTIDPQTIVASSAGAAVFSFVDAGDASLSGLVIRDGSLHGILADGDPPDAHSLTVTRCIVEDSGSPSENGGGIFADVPLIVRESVVRDNVGERGAGIAADGGSLDLEVSLVEGNVGWGDHGGGVYAYGDVRVVGNVIRGNRTGEGGSFGWGGGIIVYGEDTVAEMRGNLITGNHAPTEGSGTFVDDGAVATLVNELIVANQCPMQAGAGLYVDGTDEVGSTATLTNVTIAGHACSGGNAILLERASNVTVTSSIFWGNGGSSFRVDQGSSLEVRYSDVEEGWPGTGNLSADPLFAGAGDYHLASTIGRPSNAGACVVDPVTSPAIDAGDPAADYAAEPAPNGGRVDMGAYGNTPQAGCIGGSGTSSTSVGVGAGAGGGSTTTAATSGPGGAASTSSGAGAGTATSSGDSTAEAGAGGWTASAGGPVDVAGSGPGSGVGGAGSHVAGDGGGEGDGGGPDEGGLSAGGAGGDEASGGRWDGGFGGEGDARTGCGVASRGGAGGASLALVAAALAFAARRRR